MDGSAAHQLCATTVRSAFMLFFVGVVVVFGAILGGYMPHGKLAVLWQPFEVLIIIGAALGGFIIANPKDVIVGTMKSLKWVFVGSPHSKEGYLELLTLLYTVLRLAKSRGPLALEDHVERPAESPIFKQFPRFLANTQALTFLCDYLRLMTMGTENPHEVESLIEEEIETHHVEKERIAAAVSSVADGLPAFGIVAAVLGVITTMSHILEPPEVLGAMIGGALVGTFMGVLLSYGLVGPIAKALKSYADEDAKYLQCIKAALVAHMQGYAPAVAVEFARKTLFTTERPSFDEVEKAVSEVPAPA